MNKIKKLIEELKLEVEKETGVVPSIEIGIHQNTDQKQDISLIEANRQFESLRKKLKMEKWKLSFLDDYSRLSNSPVENDSLTIYFNDRRDEIENRQSDTRKRVQESEMHEMAIY